MYHSLPTIKYMLLNDNLESYEPYELLSSFFIDKLIIRYYLLLVYELDIECKNI